MAAQQFIPNVGPVTLTANSTNVGVVTVPDTTIGWRKGAFATLNGSGLIGVNVIIEDIIDYEHLQVRLVPNGPNQTFLAGTNPVDVSAFTTAATSTLQQYDQSSTDAVLNRVLYLLDAKGAMRPAMAPQIDNCAFIGTVGWTMDLASADVLQITSTTSTSSVTVTNGGWYWLLVSGVPASINYGASATTANAQFPVGSNATPVYIPPGTVVSAITVSGSGQVNLIPAIPKAIY